MCISYRIIITRISNSVVVFDSTRVTLSQPLYDKETLTHTVPSGTLITGVEYTWSIETYFNATEHTKSGDVYFNAYRDPTIVLPALTTVLAQQHTFIPIYSHPDNIASKRFKFILYDVVGLIIKETTWSYSGNIRCTFDGLVSGNIYRVRVLVEDQNGITVNHERVFNVSYVTPSMEVIPTAELIPEQGAVMINWVGVVQIPGVVTGVSSYQTNFAYANNTALALIGESSIRFTVAIPQNFITTFIVGLPLGFSGIICRLGTNYDIGYENNRFYFNNNGIIEHGLPLLIEVNCVFLVAIRPTDIYIRKIFI